MNDYKKAKYESMIEVMMVGVVGIWITTYELLLDKMSFWQVLVIVFIMLTVFFSMSYVARLLYIYNQPTTKKFKVRLIVILIVLVVLFFFV